MRKDAFVDDSVAEPQGILNWPRRDRTSRNIAVARMCSGQARGVWVVHRDEINACVHKGRGKRHVPRQAVELGNDECRLLPFGQSASAHYFVPPLIALAVDVAPPLVDDADTVRGIRFFKENQ